jgi:hypothetical protein
MAIRTYAQLSTEKDVIKDETTASANTADRIGEMLENIIDTTVGSSKFRGAYDASGNTFPAAGAGSGVAGAIIAGDEWYLSVAGTLDGGLWPIGTIAKALVNTPGQTTTNWRLI